MRPSQIVLLALLMLFALLPAACGSAGEGNPPTTTIHGVATEPNESAVEDAQGADEGDLQGEQESPEHGKVKGKEKAKGKGKHKGWDEDSD